MALRRYSLRRRLLVLLIGSMAVVWLGSAVVAFQHALVETDELFDAQMVQASELLLGLVRDAEVEKVVGELREQPHPYRMPIFYQVMVQQQGRWRTLAHSPSAPDVAAPVERISEGFALIELDGMPWRVFVRNDADAGGRHFRVVVGQGYGIRDQLAHEFAEHLAIPLLIGFPLMALGVWWAVSRAMRPVREAAGKVAEMGVEELRPLQLVDACPKEIAPLIEAIDMLTARVAKAIDNERRFTADAAHELRTPLAALRVQAQVAMRVSAPAERQRVLGQVMVGVERMTHLVEQMLTLARLDPAQAAVVAGGRSDLADAAAQACAELVPQAIGRNQEIQLNAPERVEAPLESAWGHALVRNLVDNALRHGREGGRVEVEVIDGGGGAALTVRDDGPGVDESRRTRLAERFYRGEDTDAEGCGLGLSIVARIVESCGARMDFIDGLSRTDGGRGFGVRVHFPQAA